MICLDDGTGCIEVNLEQVYKYDDWTGKLSKGLYFGVIGEIKVPQGDKVVVAFKLIYLSPTQSAMQEISWNLEVIDAQRNTS